MLALLAATMAAGPALAAAPAAAVDQREAHRHQGFLFRIRHEPELNRQFVYRAYLTDPADPASLIVERGLGFSGDSAQTDLTIAACPPLRRAVQALAALPLPAVRLEEARYDINAPRGEEYRFDGFVAFPNGGEGEVSFMAYDVPGRPADAHLAWMRGLVRAFDACRPRRG